MENGMPSFVHSNIFQIICLVVVTFLLLLIGRHFIDRFVRKTVKHVKGETRVDERKREDTVINVLRTTYSALVWIIAVISFLTILGVNVAALLTGAGIIGVFVGLSVQNTVKDFLSGFFILTEKQYRVGDIITMGGGSTGGGATGTVEEITLRITKLRDVNGTLTTVRNGEATVITNKTNSYASTVMDFLVTYESDIAKVEKIINTLGEDFMKEPEWHEIITKPIKFLRVDGFTPEGVTVRAIGTVRPASQWDVAGEFRKRLLTAFDKDPSVALAGSKQA